MDYTVTVTVSSVQYTTWLRSSYTGLSVVSNDGLPMIEQTELGADQEDALTELMQEATREVAKIFMSRQGDVSGVPFEYDGTTVSYRFNEEIPVLPQAAAIKSALDEDVKNALYAYVSYLWFKLKSNSDQAAYMLDRYEKLSSNIDRYLYKLHD